MSSPHFNFEDACDGIVCGIDEVGRGPLAGPVVAAAVILRRDALSVDLKSRIRDSKALSPDKRAAIATMLRDCAEISVAACTVDEIDEINILQATFRAMQKAFDALPVRPAFALVDGNRAPKLACRVQTVVKGDAQSLSIAAASIVAKHRRDTLMKEYAAAFPQYGWERNAGYGTAQHLSALAAHGVTPHHRRSFAPIRELLLSKKIA